MIYESKGVTVCDNAGSFLVWSSSSGVKNLFLCTWTGYSASFQWWSLGLAQALWRRWRCLSTSFIFFFISFLRPLYFLLQAPLTDVIFCHLYSYVVFATPDWFILRNDLSKAIKRHPIPWRFGTKNQREQNMIECVIFLGSIHIKYGHMSLIVGTLTNGEAEGQKG